MTILLLLKPTADTGGGPSPQTIEPPFIAATGDIYAPTVTPQAVTITVPHIATTGDIYAPALTPGIIIPHIFNGITLYEPTITTGPVTIEVPHIAGTSTTYAPTVTAGAVTVEPPFIAATGDIYAPTVEQGPITLTVPFIAATGALYAPTVTAGAVTIDVPHITSSSALYAPTVTPQAVTIEPPLIATTGGTFAPTITAGAVTITVPHIAAADVLYAPTVTPQAVTIEVPFIGDTTTLYAPAVSNEGALSMSFIDSTITLYPPTVTPAALTIEPPFIESTTTLYGFTVRTRVDGTIAVTLEGAFVDSNTDSFGVVTQQILEVPEIKAQRLALAPPPKLQDPNLERYLNEWRRLSQDAYNRLADSMARNRALSNELVVATNTNREALLAIPSGGGTTVTGTAELPTGGTTGQILTKRTNNSGDVQWSDPAYEVVFSWHGEIYRNAVSPRWTPPFNIVLTGMRAYLSTARAIVIYLQTPVASVPAFLNTFNPASNLNTWSFSVALSTSQWLSLVVNGQGTGLTDLEAYDLTVAVTYRRA